MIVELLVQRQTSNDGLAVLKRPYGQSHLNFRDLDFGPGGRERVEYGRFFVNAAEAISHK
jgi:hypothetical protein